MRVFKGIFLPGCAIAVLAVIFLNPDRLRADAGAAPSAASFLTGFSSTSLRNNYTGWVGFRFTVGSRPLTISTLGRICAANNTQTHIVKLVNASSGTDVAGASASVNMAGCTQGQYVYAPVAMNLPSGGSYYLVSEERTGGDRWYDHGRISTANVASVGSGVYWGGERWIPIGVANTSYVPVNFSYSTSATAAVPPPDSLVQNPSPPAGTSFITGFTSTSLRNNYTGWVGFRFTVGTNPISISALGRVCAPNNTQTHVVKLVNASSGTDIAGASASVNMAGCTPEQYVYAPVAMNLPSGGSYYLVTEERTGGDRWYEYGPISTANAASVGNGVYWGDRWIPMGGGNTSYVPPNFLYSTNVAPAPPPQDPPPPKDPPVQNGPPAGEPPADTNSLAGYWSFDTSHVSGATILDQSNYSANATAAASTFGAGKIGQAIQLNGSSSYARAPRAAASQLDLRGDLSLSVWIKTTNSARLEGIIGKYDAGGAEYGYLLRTTPAGVVEFQFGLKSIASGKRTIADVTRINDGNWHHIAAVIELGTKIHFYVDGVPSSTHSIPTIPLAVNSDFLIGAASYLAYGNYFAGSIDEVRVYNRALTQSEIFRLYNPAVAEGDTVPPSVSITSPGAGAKLSGQVTLSTAATDNANVFAVQFLVDGEGIAPSLTNAPYALNWNSASAASGPHVLTAVAVDTSGNVAVSEPVHVTVLSEPVLSEGLPWGTWPAGNGPTQLSVTTNQAAQCRYSASPGINYSAMTNSLASADGLLHTAGIPALANGNAYAYYVRCIDSLGNANLTDFPITFRVGAMPAPDGLVSTPPMGWNSWNYFKGNVSDTIVRQTADAIAASSMKDAGYTYIVIDDFWEGQRDASGVLQPNSRFPDMKALADYVHSLGLKIGIYSSPGLSTCGGNVGSYGHEQQDANTFAEWGMDFLKYDWCWADAQYPGSQMLVAYKLMGDALAATGRPIVYSLCQYGAKNVWKWGAAAGGHLWRTTSDIADNWNTMSSIGFSQADLAPFAGPGRWNDPDMLEVGNGGMTDEEYRTHMSLWAILAAPLMAGNDVRSMSPETKNILLNREVIAVDQDPQGTQGYRLSVSGSQEIWLRPLAGGSVAVGLFNRGLSAASMAVTLSALGITGPVTARDLWAHRDVSFAGGAFHTNVPPHGAIMLRIDPAQ